MTKQEKLTEWVKAALKNGWLPKGMKYIEEPYWIGRREVSFAEYFINGMVDKGIKFDTLILNPEFMKAVYGEEKRLDTIVMMKGKVDNPFMYLYHAHKALDIIMAGNCPIDYLFYNLEGK